MSTTRSPRTRWVLPWDATTSTPRVLSDDQLLVDAGGGDAEAFATLYDHVAGLVYANIRRVVHHAALTEAIAEETFIQAWRQAAWFDPSRTSALLWILDLAHDLAAGCERADAPPVDGGDPGELPVSFAADRSICSAFAELTEPQQRAIDLATLGGCAQHHIGAQLHLPTAAVRTLLRQGLLDLGAAQRVHGG